MRFREDRHQTVLIPESELALCVTGVGEMSHQALEAMTLTLLAQGRL